MRKAYNIIVTLLLLAIMAAVVVLCGRDLPVLIHMIQAVGVDVAADYYGGRIWMITYLSGVCLTALIVLVRLVMTIAGGDAGKNGDIQAGGKFGALLGAQIPVVEDWLGKTWGKKIRDLYFTSGGLAICFYILYFTRADARSNIVRPVEGFISCLFFGEALGVLFWLMIRRSGNLGKVIRGFEKDIKKELGDAGISEVFADDILNAGSEWAFRDEVKDHLGWGVVGSRYAVLFTNIGLAHVVDFTRLDRIGTTIITYSTGKGWAREMHSNYLVRFYYEKEKRKKHPDTLFEFKSDMNRTIFLTLLRQRIGERIEITQE